MRQYDTWNRGTPRLPLLLMLLAPHAQDDQQAHAKEHFIENTIRSLWNRIAEAASIAEPFNLSSKSPRSMGSMMLPIAYTRFCRQTPLFDRIIGTGR